MTTLLRLFGQGAIYFCVATLLAQAAIVGVVWSKGYLTRDRAYQVLAAVHGVNREEIRQELDAERQDLETEYPSYDAQKKQQLGQSLNLDMRETAIEKGLLDLTNLQNALEIKHNRFVELRQEYDELLKSMTDEAMDVALQNVQQTVESMSSKQAKDQLTRMFDNGGENDVVRIVLNLPNDKVKKILAEFKDDEDSSKLYEILERVRRGEPMVSSIDAARQEMQGLNPATSGAQQ